MFHGEKRHHDNLVHLRHQHHQKEVSDEVPQVLRRSGGQERGRFVLSEVADVGGRLLKEKKGAFFLEE